MDKFPHLKFIEKVTGKPRFPSGGSENSISKLNRLDRNYHSTNLQKRTAKIHSDWMASYSERKTESLADIDEHVTPIFLRINPDLLKADFDLESFGIEVISEETDGYIIGASFDNLRSLESKINGFINSDYGSGKIADLWEIFNGNHESWKPEHILSESLYNKWSEVEEDKNYNLEVSVAFTKPLGRIPDSTKKGGQARLEKYLKSEIERDDLLSKRQTHFENFIKFYGTINSSYVELEDSFGCEVTINGKGFKDLIVNYQYVFEVNEIDVVSGVVGGDYMFDDREIEILPPNDIATEVGIIDSGIMEGNKYISGAIISDNSKSYIDDNPSTADEVKGGGHGTKVAGAVLFPKGISDIPTPYNLPCFVRNLRVLNKDNLLTNKYPASLMQTIVEENYECEIFNLSICSNSPFRTKHMSSWATIIDKMINERNILFIIATGNIKSSIVESYFSKGHTYPEYLLENLCRLANPSQSSFALSVGSINHTSFEDEDWQSLGNEDDISGFSRIGTGIWDSIKPDVVEYGGGLVISKNEQKRVRQHEHTSPELVRSTLDGGSALGKDSVGTSFSTPKVAYIAAQLKMLYPEEDVNLIRAFISQGARLPGDYFLNPTKKSLQFFGYGLPLLERVTNNSENRITFYNTGKIKSEDAHIYSLHIPEALRNQGDEYDILIEVSLAYSASVRRTRQKTKSYLSTWLDWTTSRLDEDFDDFSKRCLVLLDENQSVVTTIEESSNVIKWKIRERNDWGEAKDINRNNSTLQKDWAVIKSYDLPTEIGFAIRGHKGWDKNQSDIPYSIAVSLEILGVNLPIYEMIRIENQIEIEV